MLTSAAADIRRFARERFDVLVLDDQIPEPDVVAMMHLRSRPDEPHVIVCWHRHIRQVVGVARGGIIVYLASTGDRTPIVLRLYSTGVIKKPDGTELGRSLIPGPRPSPETDAIVNGLATAPRVSLAGVGSGRLVMADTG